MTTGYVADTGVFVRCGGPGNDKYRRLRRAVRGANATLHIPRRVYEELGGSTGTGDTDVEEYPSSEIPWQEGIDEGWIVVADDLDYANPVVSSSMDEARRLIANETGRDEDAVEKADTALVGLAAQLLDMGEVTSVVLLTTDKPAGKAAARLLPDRGFRDRIEYRYVSKEYLESVTVDDFSTE